MFPYLFFLSYPMSSVHSLEIHLRIPIRVIDDDNIGRVQVDSQTSGPRAQHEDKLGGVLRVVFLDLTIPVLMSSISINSK